MQTLLPSTTRFASRVALRMPSSRQRSVKLFSSSLARHAKSACSATYCTARQYGGSPPDETFNILFYIITCGRLESGMARMLLVDRPHRLGQYGGGPLIPNTSGNMTKFSAGSPPAGASAYKYAWSSKSNGFNWTHGHGPTGNGRACLPTMKIVSPGLRCGVSSRSAQVRYVCYVTAFRARQTQSMWDAPILEVGAEKYAWSSTT